MQAALTTESLYAIFFCNRRIGIHGHEAEAAPRSLGPRNEPMIDL